MTIISLVCVCVKFINKYLKIALKRQIGHFKLNIIVTCNIFIQFEGQKLSAIAAGCFLLKLIEKLKRMFFKQNCFERGEKVIKCILNFEAFKISSHNSLMLNNVKKQFYKTISIPQILIKRLFEF